MNVSLKKRIHIPTFVRACTAFLAVFLLFGSMVPVVAAVDKNAQILEELTTPEDQPTEEEEELTDEEKKQIQEDISTINEDIEEKQAVLDELQKEIQNYDNAIKVKQREEVTLSNEISILDDGISKKELDIQRAADQIDVYGLQIQDLETEVTTKEQEIELEKKELGDIIRRLDKYGRKTNLELVVGNDSFSDFYAQQQYVKNLSDSTQKQLEHISTLKASLEEQRQNVESKKQGVEEEKKGIERQQQQLLESQDLKEYYLKETQNSEEKFRDLVLKFKAEHLEAERIISGLQKEAQRRLAELEGTEDELFFDSGDFIWPVYPGKGISCAWHCPGYPYEYLIGPHSAIDIPTAQGTAVKASADGVVSVAKVGVGSGYSYVMLVHPDGFATVYGHLSSVGVVSDQIVRQGEAIGLSGGRPGFPGAGLSTGPHLHFGVRINGIPVDPAPYLDMSIVP